MLLLQLRATLAATLLVAGCTGSWADVQQCLVVEVSDGDTLTARCGGQGLYQQVKVRLSGIDAPEKRQPYGTRARLALGSMVFGRWARLECPKTDRYGRQLCAVWVAPASTPGGAQTLDAGQAMVTLGLAWWYRAYARDQAPEARRRYELAEEKARAGRAGLWGDPAPVAPWDWRRSAKPALAVEHVEARKPSRAS